MNDKLFTQELIELVNNNSCSLIGEKKYGCAYNLNDFREESCLGKHVPHNAMPKKLSISFKVEKESVKITSVSLRTVGCGSISMNTKEYKAFRSACNGVIERCYLTNKCVYKDLKRVVVKFGEGEVSYSVDKKILTVENIPIIRGYVDSFFKSEASIISHVSEMIQNIKNNLGDVKVSVVGYGVSRLVRSDYCDCSELYSGCRGAEEPTRKANICLNVAGKDCHFRFYLNQRGSPVGLEEGALFKNALELCKTYC